jgi:Na+-transporting methylmalonyl-CoA/oxaloacetate decarboxylase gamma subunit
LNANVEPERYKMATQSELMSEALKLLLLGMGFVFLMLGIMVLAIKALSYLTRDTGDTAAFSLTGSAPVLTPRLSLSVLAAIGAAVHAYRGNHPHSHDPEHPL